MDEYTGKFTHEPAEDGEDSAQDSGGEIQRGVQCDCEEGVVGCENSEDGTTTTLRSTTLAR